MYGRALGRSQRSTRTRVGRRRLTQPLVALPIWTFPFSTPSGQIRELPVARRPHADFEKLSALKGVIPGGVSIPLRALLFGFVNYLSQAGDTRTSEKLSALKEVPGGGPVSLFDPFWSDA
jgi:hypothetical protein